MVEAKARVEYHMTIMAEPWPEEVVREFYSEEDNSFFKCCHKEEGDFESCVKSTLDSLSPNAEMFCVYVGKERAAFFVKTVSDEFHSVPVVLEGFHVKKRYRVGWFLDFFWTQIRGLLGPRFATGIYYKNARAYRHLENNGMRYYAPHTVDGKLFYIFKSQ